MVNLKQICYQMKVHAVEIRKKHFLVHAVEIRKKHYQQPNCRIPSPSPAAPPYEETDLRAAKIVAVDRPQPVPSDPTLCSLLWAVHRQLSTGCFDCLRLSHPPNGSTSHNCQNFNHWLNLQIQSQQCLTL